MAVVKVVSKRWRGSLGDKRSSNQRPREGMAWVWSVLILPMKCAFYCTFRAIMHSQLASHGGSKH